MDLSARGAQQQLAEAGGRKETRGNKNAVALAAHASTIAGLACARKAGARAVTIGPVSRAGA
jgi:hypothetical protein